MIVILYETVLWLGVLFMPVSHELLDYKVYKFFFFLNFFSEWGTDMINKIRVTVWRFIMNNENHFV